jgi:uncharacterized protein YbjQ (UPF0145 family)
MLKKTTKEIEKILVTGQLGTIMGRMVRGNNVKST